MNALVRAQHDRSSREFLSELVSAVDALVPAVVDVDRLAADRDRAALERLERIAERCNALARLSLQARVALATELRQPSSEIA